MKFVSSMIVLLTLGAPALAQNIDEIVKIALERSPDLAAASSEVKVQELTAKSVRQTKYIPQVTLGLALQDIRYDRLQADGNGNLISNNGTNLSQTVMISYDLQKLLGPEGALADLAIKNSQLQKELSRRAVVRDAKKAFVLIVELKSEIAAMTSAIDRFAKVSGVIERERHIGVDTRLEKGQFQIQKDLVEADLLVRKTDLEAAVVNLALILAEPPSVTEKRFESNQVIVSAKFQNPESISPEDLARTGDLTVMQALRADADLQVAEASKYTQIPLPTVYAKMQKDNSNVFTSDGPQTTFEVGFNLPLDAAVSRSTQNQILSARAQKAIFTANRATIDYTNQIRLQASRLKRAAIASKSFALAESESQRLLNQAFKYYGQKRIDALGATDLFQKHLQSVRNNLNNRLQLQLSDADLEYLVGEGSK